MTQIPEEIKLVAVTKGRLAQEVLDFLNTHDVQRIAENRVKDGEEKFPLLDGKIEKHYIGKLQSRRIPDIVRLFDVIQTLEDLEQAKLVSKAAQRAGKCPYPVFIEVNLSALEQRSGVSVQDFHRLMEEVSRMKTLKLLGVMGMASDREHARQEFGLLKALQGGLPECSMGMSDDYDLAIQAGSTMLRLGRILFDK